MKFINYLSLAGIATMVTFSSTIAAPSCCFFHQSHPQEAPVTPAPKNTRNQECKDTAYDARNVFTLPVGACQSAWIVTVEKCDALYPSSAS
ncbi:hypothetical protein BGZ49_010777 [Haplosporangium sp. Z 27]|nr:hypothetical protein BGZ49_010777 [Haplosporangium sp. Z 27]